MNYYAKAIDIVFKTKESALPLLVEVAKKNPAAIVNAYHELLHGQWVKEVIPLLKAGAKLPAIKKCREITGMGLREAKEACEAIRL